MKHNLNEQTKAYIDSLPLLEQDQVYRYLWHHYIEEDIASYASDNDICLTDKEIEIAADYFVYEGEYDCNSSYWDNIKAVIDLAKGITKEE